MSIKVAKVLDVADGPVPEQFTVVEHKELPDLASLDPVYKRLLDEPVTAVVGIIGEAGLPMLTPVWFGYEGDLVLLNLAAHRKKVGWLRKRPHATFLLVNPQNPYHWVSLKTTVIREISEDDPVEGSRATATIDQAWVKYTGAPPPYGLRDPAMDERRVLFEMRIDEIATFGRP